MFNYLFFIFKYCLGSFSLFLFFSSSSAIAEYKDTRYINTGGGFIICTKSGIEKLYSKRLSQVEKKEVIYTQGPRVLEFVSEEEGCYFRNTEVIFNKIAEEYTLPTTEKLVSDESGEEHCPWNALERCSLITAPAAHYVESKALGEDGKWYGPLFIEMGPTFKLLDRLEEPPQAEEDRTPDALLKTPAE